MANPSKAKGTLGENEVRDALALERVFVTRTSPSVPWDLQRPPGKQGAYDLEALATRPDRGEWLVTLRLSDFGRLVAESDEVRDIESSPRLGLHVEVKRYARFALHSIWNKKFGGKK